MVGTVKKRSGGREAKTKNKKSSPIAYQWFLSAPLLPRPYLQAQGQGWLPEPWAPVWRLRLFSQHTHTRAFWPHSPLNLTLLLNLPLHLVLLQQIKCSAHMWLRRPQPPSPKCPPLKSGCGFLHPAGLGSVTGEPGSEGGSTFKGKMASFLFLLLAPNVCISVASAFFRATWKWIIQRFLFYLWSVRQITQTGPDLLAPWRPSLPFMLTSSDLAMNL